MPILLGLSVIFQIACLVHAVKTGRSNTWIFIILAFSGLGAGAYFFMEMLPDLRQSRAGRQAVKNVLKTLDPQMALKKAAQDLRVSDNVENKMKLAEQCVAQGLYEEAEELSHSCLTGLFQTDPKIMLSVANIQFLREKYAEAKAMLETLIQANPAFKSQDGHLLYARCLEALHENDRALAEYQVLADYYRGAEAKCRYALLLNKLGKTEQAQRLFQEILNYAKDAPKFYRQAQKQWLEIAKQHM